jgi:hypothetical protein
VTSGRGSLDPSIRREVISEITLLVELRATQHSPLVELDLRQRPLKVLETLLGRCVCDTETYTAPFGERM